MDSYGERRRREDWCGDSSDDGDKLGGMISKYLEWEGLKVEVSGVLIGLLREEGSQKSVVYIFCR